MKAVILAAGVGSRIRPLTDHTPKPLLQISGKSILQRMVDAILEVSINQIIVVTGYHSEQIQNFLTRTYPGISVTFINNQRYPETNTGYSLLQTKEAVRDDAFIKFDADVIFEPAVLEKLLNRKTSALCIDKNIRLETEEVKVITDEDMRVVEVGKKINPKRANGESIGIEKIDKAAAKVLFKQLQILMNDKANWQQYYDDSYTTLVQKGIPMDAVDVTGLKWVEIDTHQDLERAKKLFTQ